MEASFVIETCSYNLTILNYFLLRKLSMALEKRQSLIVMIQDPRSTIMDLVMKT